MIAIAIDGPSGAGKSTIARAIADQEGYIYVDTGALYRCIGLYALNHGADPSKKEEVIPLLEEIQVELKHRNGEQRAFVNGKDVSEEIRRPEMSMAASQVSAISEVRNFLFQLQQDIAERHPVIMDGRDIGTVVLPHAQVKIFLTATPEERAKRRYAELKQRGMEQDYESVLKDIGERDYNDSHREVAPLKVAEDAIEFDTTHLSFQQVVEGLITIIKEKIQ